MNLINLCFILLHIFSVTYWNDYTLAHPDDHLKVHVRRIFDPIVDDPEAERAVTGPRSTSARGGEDKDERQHFRVSQWKVPHTHKTSPMRASAGKDPPPKAAIGRHKNKRSRSAPIGGVYEYQDPLPGRPRFSITPVRVPARVTPDPIIVPEAKSSEPSIKWMRPLLKQGVAVVVDLEEKERQRKEEEEEKRKAKKKRKEEARKRREGKKSPSSESETSSGASDQHGESGGLFGGWLWFKNDEDEGKGQRHSRSGWKERKKSAHTSNGQRKTHVRSAMSDYYEYSGRRRSFSH